MGLIGTLHRPIDYLMFSSENRYRHWKSSIGAFLVVDIGVISSLEIHRPYFWHSRIAQSTSLPQIYTISDSLHERKWLLSYQATRLTTLLDQQIHECYGNEYHEFSLARCTRKEQLYLRWSLPVVDTPIFLENLLWLWLKTLSLKRGHKEEISMSMSEHKQGQSCQVATS